ncbi:hypothetical protein [Nannocystis punicea]|uniref:Uncharacterized protein n=1 Tax=Nannocystis punicea TaxID=2995304 RepID=A0ABY7HDM0_9BACT|nr:hypothetical protein [Nannocystis poenicansa]WAS97218.1 hypothetical protein O0S08_13810 [Nannocystis poenicansa]
MKSFVAPTILAFLAACTDTNPEPDEPPVVDMDHANELACDAGTESDTTGDVPADDGPGSGSGGDGLCRPVIDVLGTVIGTACWSCSTFACTCPIEQTSGACLAPCNEACNEGFTCRPIVIDAELLDVCWPV